MATTDAFRIEVDAALATKSTKTLFEVARKLLPDTTLDSITAAKLLEAFVDSNADRRFRTAAGHILCNLAALKAENTSVLLECPSVSEYISSIFKSGNEVLRLTAGLLFRAMLNNGMLQTNLPCTFGSEIPSGMKFPTSTSSSWVEKFHDFVISLPLPFSATYPTSLIVVHGVDAVADDDTSFAEKPEGVVLLTDDTGLVVLIMDAQSNVLHYVDIPGFCIEHVKRCQSKIFSRSQSKTHIVHSILFQMVPGRPWHIKVDEAPRTADIFRVHCCHEVDAIEALVKLTEWFKTVASASRPLKASQTEPLDISLNGADEVEQLPAVSKISEDTSKTDSKIYDSKRTNLSDEIFANKVASDLTVYDIPSDSDGMSDDENSDEGSVFDPRSKKTKSKRTSRRKSRKPPNTKSAVKTKLASRKRRAQPRPGAMIEQADSPLDEIKTRKGPGKLVDEHLPRKACLVDFDDRGPTNQGFSPIVNRNDTTPSRVHLTKSTVLQESQYYKLDNAPSDVAYCHESILPIIDVQKYPDTKPEAIQKQDQISAVTFKRMRAESTSINEHLQFRRKVTESPSRKQTIKSQKKNTDTLLPDTEVTGQSGSRPDQVDDTEVHASGHQREPLLEPAVIGPMLRNIDSSATVMIRKKQGGSFVVDVHGSPVALNLVRLPQRAPGPLPASEVLCQYTENIVDLEPNGTDAARRPLYHASMQHCNSSSSFQSNSKPVPPTPGAPSSAISLHVTEKEMQDACKRQKDIPSPFLQPRIKTEPHPATSFLQMLHTKHVAMQDVITKKETRSADNDETLAKIEEGVCRFRQLSISEVSSASTDTEKNEAMQDVVSSSSDDSSEIEDADTSIDEIKWEQSLQPELSSTKDALFAISKQLLMHLNTQVQSINSLTNEQFRADCQQLVSGLFKEHAHQLRTLEPVFKERKLQNRKHCLAALNEANEVKSTKFSMLRTWEDEKSASTKTLEHLEQWMKELDDPVAEGIDYNIMGSECAEQTDEND